MKNLIDLQKRIINGRFLILALYIIGLTFLQSCSKEDLTPTASNSTMSSDKRQLTMNADKLPVASNGNARYADESGFTLNVKVLIQGFYDINTHTMIASLDPIAQPDIADNITVELHDDIDPRQIVASITGTIDIKGNGTFEFPSNTIAKKYYIVIRHRSALETWSATPIGFDPNFPAISYDFTAQDQVFGKNVADLGDGSFGLFSGDISDATLGVGHQDGIIESQDFSDLENALNIVLTGYVTEDITGDAVVESADYSMILNNVSMVIAVKSPISLNN